MSLLWSLCSESHPIGQRFNLLVFPAYMIFFQIIKVNDKERVAAALEKDSMIRLVDQCINNEEG